MDRCTLKYKLARDLLERGNIIADTRHFHPPDDINSCNIFTTAAATAASTPFQSAEMTINPRKKKKENKNGQDHISVEQEEFVQK